MRWLIGLAGAWAVRSIERRGCDRGGIRTLEASLLNEQQAAGPVAWNAAHIAGHRTRCDVRAGRTPLARLLQKDG